MWNLEKWLRTAFLTEEIKFPDVKDFPPKRDFVAFGGDLSAERLIKAYECGIFPMPGADGRLEWFSPTHRMVLFPGKIIISKSMAKVMRSGIFSFTFDHAFEEVINHCASVERRKQKNGTWINSEIISSYTQLHHEGYAHSLEVWKDEKLVGGLYGISLGKMFFGESMFALNTNSSKAAMIKLNEFVVRNDFDLIDCQLFNPHLESLGAHTISRKKFYLMLEKTLRHPTLKGSWKGYL